MRLESSGSLLTDPKVVKKTDPNVPAEGLVATSPALSDPIVAAFFSSDGKKIYAAVRGGIVHVLDPLTLEETQKFSIAEKKGIIDAIAAPQTRLTDREPFEGMALRSG